MPPTKPARPRPQIPSGFSSEERGGGHGDRSTPKGNAGDNDQLVAPHGPVLSAAHNGPEPHQDDALPLWAWPVAAMVLVVWHALAFCYTSLLSIRPDRTRLRPRDALDRLVRIGHQSRYEPWTKGERMVHLNNDQVYKVPLHLAIAYTPSTQPQPDPEVLGKSMQRYAYAAAQAGVRQLSWFDPEGLVVSTFPTPTKITVPNFGSGEHQQQEPLGATSTQRCGKGSTSVASRQRKNAPLRVTLDISPHITQPSSHSSSSSDLHVTLLSASDGKASLAHLASSLLQHATTPESSAFQPITTQTIDRAWYHRGGIPPPQLLLLKTSAAAPLQRTTTISPHVCCAQLPDFPPWVLGLTELVFCEGGVTEEEEVLGALKQLTGAGQRYGR